MYISGSNLNNVQYIRFMLNTPYRDCNSMYSMSDLIGNSLNIQSIFYMIN